MKLVADNKIPYVTDFFATINDIVLLPSQMITPDALIDADVLLIRTVTSVNSELLKKTPVRLVGTATTGIDHVDQKWLSRNHIALVDAAGANAPAVAEYIFFCIAALKANQYLNQENVVVGVVGYGRIGRLVANMLQKLGFTVLSYDPFCSPQENPYHVSFEALIHESDLITLHPPLTRTGPHPTFHLMNQKVMRQMKKNSVLINAARGEVIDQAALLKTSHIIACLDVWENEPHICRELLNKVVIGTPHIAGYSACAKYRATKILYEKTANFFNWGESSFQIKTPFNHTRDNDLLAHYNPIKHTEQFRAAFLDQTEIAKIFVTQRQNYPLRSEWGIAHGNEVSGIEASIAFG